MNRTSMLALAFAGMALAAAPVPEPQGFRVYSIRSRCGNRFLKSVHESVDGAFLAAAALGDRALVTTGTEGRRIPYGEPVFHIVYAKGCKSSWAVRMKTGDKAKAEAAAAALVKEGTTAQVVADFAPQEFYQVYSPFCRTRRVFGVYPTLAQAIEAAEALRAAHTPCEVSVGKRGHVFSKTEEYQVFAQGCRRSGWLLKTVTTDHEQAMEAAAGIKKAGGRVELVHRYKAD